MSGSRGCRRMFQDLEPEKLDSFAEEQLRQLLDLKLESERLLKAVEVSEPVVEESTTGEEPKEDRPEVK